MVGSTISHYKVTEKLGEGGMGVVYKAEDTKLERSVALKFLAAHAIEDPEHQARFLREAKAAARLDHQNICSIYEIGEAAGRTFLAMAYLEGQTLKDKIAERPLKLDEVLDIALQTALGLKSAHQKGIVHRDIKPANLMLTEEGLVKIMDFGLAQLAEGSKLTKTETILGTPAYMSPEQARREPTDHRTDVWSLGVVIYEMVTGRLPFKGERQEAVLYAIGHEDPEPITALRAGLPMELEFIVGKALAKQPDERYQHVEEMIVDLRSLVKKPPSVKGTEIRMPGAVASPRARPAFLQSNPRMLATLIGVLMLIAVGSYLLWSPPLARVPGKARVNSLAVLPFRSLSGAEPDEYLGLGIADTLITKVSRIKSLTVRPFSAVRSYSGSGLDALQVAKDLRVGAVLEGTVQRDRGRIRVSANLLRADDGQSLWAETFDTPLTDIFDVQDRVAREVAARLRSSLTSEEQTALGRKATTNLQAQEYFLRAATIFDRRERLSSANALTEHKSAAALFQKALDLDPGYARARAQLAYVYAWTAVFVEPENPQWLELARDHLRRAEELDSQPADVHIVRHQLLNSVFEGYRSEQAVNELLRAQELDPSVAHTELGNLFAHMGLEEPAIRHLKRALEINPLSDRGPDRLIAGYIRLGRYEEAMAANERLFNRPGPSDALLAAGRLSEAEATVQADLERNLYPAAVTGQSALFLALKGNFSEAQARISEIAEMKNDFTYHHGAHSAADVFALQGKPQEAVYWLREASENGLPSYLLFSRDPHLNEIREAPEFVEFIREQKAQWERWSRMFP